MSNCVIVNVILSQIGSGLVIEIWSRKTFEQEPLLSCGLLHVPLLTYHVSMTHVTYVSHPSKVAHKFAH